MLHSLLLPVFAALLLAGCANPLNRATSDRYAEQCASANAAGRLSEAEQACYRAAVNVDWGNLGPELKSQRMYNLGLIKRKTGKFSEAEFLLRESLGIEETLTGNSSLKVARRLVELSATLAELKRWDDGLPYLKRVVSINPAFAGNERDFTRLVYTEYSKALRQLGKPEDALAFEDAARGL